MEEESQKHAESRGFMCWSLHFKYFVATESIQNGQKKSAEQWNPEDSCSPDTPLTREDASIWHSQWRWGGWRSLIQPAAGLTSYVVQCAEAGFQTSNTLCYVKEARCSKDYLLHDPISLGCPEKASLDKQKAEEWLPGAESTADGHVGSFWEMF